MLERHNEERRRVERQMQDEALQLAAQETGPAVVLGDDDEIDVTAERAAIIRRYVMPWLVPAYEESRAEHRAIIRVALDRLTGWSFDES